MSTFFTYRRTRMAPTPSGYLHLGNAVSFLLTATLARRTGAKVLLRIDDLDRQRVRPDYIQDIFDTLHFLEIGWDEGPRNVAEFEGGYSQAYRMSLYQGLLERLRKGGHLFACTCTRTAVLQHSSGGAYPGTCCHRNIPLDTPGVCWRLKTDAPIKLNVKKPDGSFTGARLPASMQSFVVRKKDGYPSYQLASVADDLYYSVDLIVRGADLWPSTLAQLYLASLIGENDFLETAFCHHTLLTDTNGRKLSKSDGAESIKMFRANGGKPSFISELMARLQEGENLVLPGRLRVPEG